jgi:hypothetical protein
MPSQIIHVLAGRAAIDRAGFAGGACPFSPSPAAFNLGCQGPDLFSHNRRTKPLALAYARLLHRHGYGRFCASVAENLGENAAAHRLSWLYGFVTHQAVDRVLHPYIVNRSFVPEATGIPGVTPALFHAFLERILDATLLVHLGLGPVSSFDLIDSLRLPAQELSDLVSLIAPALVAVYPSEDGLDTDVFARVQNAFTDSLFFWDLTDPVHTALATQSGVCPVRDFMGLGAGGVALLYPEAADPSVDWLNLANAEWAHPVSGLPDSRSVPELFADAVVRAADAIVLLSRFFSGEISGSDLEDGLSNDCLSIAGADGRIGSVNFFEPFDLGRVLLAETEKRRLWFDRMVC